MIYQRESVKDCYEESLPLLKEHWAEVDNLGSPIDPDIETYLTVEEAGFIRVYTVRDNDSKKLLGYAIYFVRRANHFKNELHAVQDMIFIRKESRGLNGDFIRWCDQQLKAEGVNVVFNNVKVAHDFGPLLERLGYTHVEQSYARRLN